MEYLIKLFERYIKYGNVRLNLTIDEAQKCLDALKRDDEINVSATLIDGIIPYKLLTCPSCNNFHFKGEETLFKYCPMCGQKIKIYKDK